MKKWLKSAVIALGDRVQLLTAQLTKSGGDLYFLCASMLFLADKMPRPDADGLWPPNNYLPQDSSSPLATRRRSAASIICLQRRGASSTKEAGKHVVLTSFLSGRVARSSMLGPRQRADGGTRACGPQCAKTAPTKGVSWAFKL